MLTVIGSINLDISSQTDCFPTKGETVIGSDPVYSPGGKGANQANAAIKFCNSVTMIGAVGEDQNAVLALANLNSNNVNLDFIKTIHGVPTGVALITRDRSGENQIVVCSGANRHLELPENINDIICKSNTLLFQGETPLDTSLEAAGIMKDNGGKVIFNTAPVTISDINQLKYVDILIANIVEIKSLVEILEIKGKSGYRELATQISKIFNLKVLVTLGDKGSALYDPINNPVEIPSYPVKPVDTTGAGDTYAGVFSACICEGIEIEQAMYKATVAAALSCQKVGAQIAQPSRQQVESAIETAG